MLDETARIRQIPVMDDYEARRAEEDRRKRLRREGESVANARKDAKDQGGRTPEQVRKLREAASKTAAICGACFRPLKPTDSVTRSSGRVILAKPVKGRFGYEHEAHLGVPICLTCWLIELERDRWQRYGLTPPEGLKRLRCEGCGRPMRVIKPHGLWGLVCCTDCHAKATLKRANKRRKVHHREVACSECGKVFVPKRSDAVTCSNACRQRAHRKRHR